VPALAAGLADVLVLHADPLVLFGLEQHLLDPASVLLLDSSTSRERVASFVHRAVELIAQRFELGEVEQAWAAAVMGSDGGKRFVARPRRAEQFAELGLEPGDLPKQGAAGGTLVRGGPGKEDSSRRCAGTRILEHHLITDISGCVASRVWVKT
jgi:hypothetical protein